MPFQGSTLLSHLVQLSRPHATCVSVVGRARGDDDGVEWIGDEHPGGGPVQAVATALRHLNRDTMVIACDMPLLTDRHFDWLLSSWRLDHERPGLVSTGANGYQPMFAVYSVRLLPMLDSAVASGTRSFRDVIDMIRIPTIAIPQELEVGMTNINTIDDYHALPGIDRSSA